LKLTIAKRTLYGLAASWKRRVTLTGVESSPDDSTIL